MGKRIVWAKIVAVLVCFLIFSGTSPLLCQTSDSCAPGSHAAKRVISTCGWPSFRGDNANTGWLPSDCGISKDYNVPSKQIKGPTSIDVAVVGQGNRAYVGFFGRQFECIDIDKSEIVWSFKPNGGVVCTPSLDGDVIVFGSWQKTLYCVNAESGGLLWSLNTPITTPVTIEDSKVYFGTSDGDVVCIDRETARPVWSYETTSTFAFAKPTLSRGRLYIGDFSGTLHCIDAKTGKKVFSKGGFVQIRTTIAASMPYLYFGAMDGFVHCLDDQDGGEVWKVDAKAPIESSPAVGGGVVVIGTGTGKLLCLNQDSGAQLWAFQARYRIISSPIIAGDKVYLSTLCQGFHCIQLSTGLELWGIEDLIIHSSPSCIGNRVLIGSDHGTLYIFGEGEQPKQEGPPFTMSPRELDFGNMRPGQQEGLDLTIENKTQTPLLLSIECKDDWLSVSKKSVQLSPERSSSLKVRAEAKGEKGEKLGKIIISFESYIASVPARLNIVPEGQTVCDWPMFRSNKEHTGFAPYGCSPKGEEFELLWALKTGGGIESSPSVVDGMIYVGSFDRKMRCVNGETGQEAWSYETQDGILSSPAVWMGKVFFGGWDRWVYCLDKKTGEKVWAKETGDQVWASPLVLDGRVFIGSFDDNLYCLDAETGQEVWRFKTDGDIQSSCAADDQGRIYFGGIDGNLYCVDSKTGELVWKFAAKGVVTSSPCIGYGKVFFGTWGRQVYCLSQDDGRKIWQFESKEAVESSPAIGFGKIFVGSNDHYFYCLKEDTGELIWTFEDKERKITSSPLVDEEGKIFVGT